MADEQNTTTAADTPAPDGTQANGNETKAKTAKLVGYGRLAGKTTEANILEVKGDVVLLEIVDPKGARTQAKFKKADGEPLTKDAKGGFKIAPDSLKRIQGKKADTPARSTKPDPNPDRKCKCGCGAETKPGRNFAQGHDAKAHSMVKQFLRGQKPEAELASASAYIQEHVKADGGYGSQRPEPKPTTTNGEKKLTGAAAKAAEAKAAREAAAAQAQVNPAPATAGAPA